MFRQVCEGSSARPRKGSSWQSEEHIEDEHRDLRTLGRVKKEGIAGTQQRLGLCIWQVPKQPNSKSYRRQNDRSS